MLYSKPITEISWDDVVAFCAESTQENAVLEFKQDFPTNNQNLAKVMAAMANTLGGLIIIGVEDDDSRPVNPITGIEYVDGLSERVTSIAVSAITPPIFPEVQACQNDTGDRAVLVIRVAESDHTPHAISSNTKVYIRTGNITTPEDLATLDRIEWLRDRRRKAAQLRQELLKNADERFRHIYDLKIDEWRQTHDTIEFPGGGWLTLTTCPLFPMEPLTEPPSLLRIYGDIRVRDDEIAGRQFPLPNHIPQTYLQGGVAVDTLFENLYYVDLDVYGRYYYRQGLYPRARDENDNPLPVILFRTVLRAIDRFLASASAFYELLGYRGQVAVGFHLACHEWGLLRYPAPFAGQADPYLLDGEVDYSATMLAGSMLNQSRDFVRAAAKRLGWAYNWNVSDAVIDQYFDEHPTE